MKRVCLTLIALTLPLCAQSTRSLGGQDPYPSARPAAPKAAAPKPAPAVQPTVPAGQFDAHWIQADEYFVLEKEQKDGRIADAWLAKLVTPATDQTKQEAEFFIVNGRKKGQKLWSKHYFKTQVADAATLKLGDRVIFFDYTQSREGYTAPAARDKALAHHFSVGTVTDDSERYKQVLSVGNKKVNLGNFRIAVK